MTNEQILALNKKGMDHFLYLDDGRTDYINNTAGTCRAISDIETIVAQGKRIAELEQKLGLTEITLDHKKVLLSSCESALQERDSKLEQLKAAQQWISDIGGILTYSTNGTNKVCGQTVGANGAGSFVKIFMGDQLTAHDQSREHINQLQSEGYSILEAIFVPNEEGYHGNLITVTPPEGE